jgi:hypothetical protein
LGIANKLIDESLACFVLVFANLACVGRRQKFPIYHCVESLFFQSSFLLSVAHKKKLLAFDMNMVFNSNAKLICFAIEKCILSIFIVYVLQKHNKKIYKAMQLW